MARTIVDSNLKDRTARGRLKARRKPYWREIEPNLAVGYRRLKGRKGAPAGAGTWSARHYNGAGSYSVEKIDGVADDFSDANGVTVLDFKQAQDRARALHLQRQTASEITGPLTVTAAIERHLEHLAGLGQNVSNQRHHARAFILPALGDVEVSKLTAAQLRRWHHGLAKLPPRVRTKAGAPQQHREIEAGDTEAVRRRQSSRAQGEPASKGQQAVARRRRAVRGAGHRHHRTRPDDEVGGIAQAVAMVAGGLAFHPRPHSPACSCGRGEAEGAVVRKAGEVFRRRRHFCVRQYKGAGSRT